jgi:hypothetical protein
LTQTDFEITKIRGELKEVTNALDKVRLLSKLKILRQQQFEKESLMETFAGIEDE